MGMHRTHRALGIALIGGSLLAAGITPAFAGGHPVRFVSIQADSPGTDDGSNASLNAEYVVLKNYSSRAVRMGRYAIAIGSKEYDFPSAFQLQPGSKVRVHTGKGKNARHDVYWGRTRYVYPNKPRYVVSLWGPGGTQNGQQVTELEDTCAVFGPTSVNGPC
jgi:hypothetical protein